MSPDFQRREIFATGIRGHILYSSDFGDSWTQAESVPVRSSLLDAASVFDRIRARIDDVQA